MYKIKLSTNIEVFGQFVYKFCYFHSFEINNNGG